ncbi:MAG: hypothetical protein M1813_002810 [Trichoglossum hirsutum]|jgi:hypothetical protein|nr:MAG: hypothetical protein M1813_002810 [Trichoglossum hirsutum]
MLFRVLNDILTPEIFHTYQGQEDIEIWSRQKKGELELEVDKILLSRYFPVFLVWRCEFLIEAIRVNVISVNLIVIIIFAGDIAFVFSSSCSLTVKSAFRSRPICTSLPNLSSPIHMLEFTLFVVTSSSIAIVRALMDMAFSTITPLITESQSRKGTADKSSRVDPNMGISAMGVRAHPSKKMNTSRNSVRGRIMRKIANITGRTGTFQQKFLADSNLTRIVNVRAFRTS